MARSNIARPEMIDWQLALAGTIESRRSEDAALAAYARYGPIVRMIADPTHPIHSIIDEARRVLATDSADYLLDWLAQPLPCGRTPASLAESHEPEVATATLQWMRSHWAELPPGLD